MTGRILFLVFLLIVFYMAFRFVIAPGLARRREARTPWVVRYGTLSDGSRELRLVRGSEREPFRVVPPYDEDPYDALYDEAKMEAIREVRDRNRVLKEEGKL